MIFMVDKEIIEITSLSDFIHRVSLQDGTLFHSRTTNLRPIYRGQANCKWPIEPAVYRHGRFNYETNYIREIERLEPYEFMSLSRIEKLIKMQHYGIPTRLIDFTYNSLVALYFACCSQNEYDGIVFDVHAFPLYNQDFVWISIIMKFLFEFSRLSFSTKDMINELKQNISEYPTREVEPFYENKALEKILTSPIGVYPHLSNDRIKNQDGVFIIAGMSIEKYDNNYIIFEKQSYDSIKQLWPESRSVIIPSKSKNKILRDLEKIGIHKRKLFPELEVQANYVTEYIDSLK